MTGWQLTKSEAYIESVEQQLLNVNLTWVGQFWNLEISILGEMERSLIIAESE